MANIKFFEVFKDYEIFQVQKKLSFILFLSEVPKF